MDSDRYAGNNRRAGDSTLLVSFCNTGEAGHSVASVDLEARRPKPAWIEIRAGARLRGGRGLCFWRDLVCVAHQPGPRAGIAPGFVLLDPAAGMAEVGRGDLPATPHSVCERDDHLYFTVSDEDSVYRASPAGGPEVWGVSRHWTLPGSSGTADENHVNAIELVDGSLCVSATGRKERGSKLWASAKRGFVYDIEAETHLMRDLRQPHSLLEDDGRAWTCETRRSRVVSTLGDEYRLPGCENWRVRGLAINEDHLYVGISKNRLGSKSAGTLRGYEGTCRVFRFARGRPEPQLLFDFSATHDEIYELMLL